MIVVSYVDADGMKRVEKRTVQPGDQIIKEMVMPGLYGFKDLHITHLHIAPGTMVICTTNEALSDQQKDRITREVEVFLNSN